MTIGAGPLSVAPLGDGGSTASQLAGAAQLGSAVASGSIAMAGASILLGNATLGGVVASGTLGQSGLSILQGNAALGIVVASGALSGGTASQLAGSAQLVRTSASGTIAGIGGAAALSPRAGYIASAPQRRWVALHSTLNP